MTAVNINWSGNATPSGMLTGFDIDQVNRDNFGIDSSTSPSYVLDVTGNDSFSSFDGTNVTSQTDNVTTYDQDNYFTTGTDNFNLHIEGPSNAHQITWDDTVDAATSGYEVTQDTSGNNLTRYVNLQTNVEDDHTEGTVGPDGTFQLTSFSIDSTDDTDFNDNYTGVNDVPEPGGADIDNSVGGNQGHDHEHLVASGSPDSWDHELRRQRSGQLQRPRQRHRHVIANC